MREISDQFVFDFPARAARDAENFLVGPNNAEALERLDQWPHWPDPIFFLCGPEGCGKSHLVNVWRHLSGARKIQAARVTQKQLNTLGQCKDIAIEDIDRGKLDETALFHLFNLARENGLHLLLTSRKLPGQLDISLPDLRSRLRSIPVAQMHEPDEDLMKIIMIKLLEDRQLNVSPEVANYIFARIERSMSALLNFIDKLDSAALLTGRKITRQFARTLL